MELLELVGTTESSQITGKLKEELRGWTHETKKSQNRLDLDPHEFTLIQHLRNYLNFMVTLHFISVRLCVGGPPCVRKQTFTSFRRRLLEATASKLNLSNGSNGHASPVARRLKRHPPAKKEGPCCEGIKLKQYCPFIRRPF